MADGQRLVGDPGVLEQLGGGRAGFVVQLEGLLEEIISFGRNVRRDGRFRGRADLRRAKLAYARHKGDGRGVYLEDSLHLRELCPGMLACQHLDNEAADTPDIGFLRVRCLLDHFRCHPEHGSLQRGPVGSVTRQ